LRSSASAICRFAVTHWRIRRIDAFQAKLGVLTWRSYAFQVKLGLRFGMTQLRISSEARIGFWHDAITHFKWSSDRVKLVGNTLSPVLKTKLCSETGKAWPNLGRLVTEIFLTSYANELA
jgi:hypothetical protein